MGMIKINHLTNNTSCSQYCEGSDIIIDGSIDGVKVAVGMALCTVGIVASYLNILKKIFNRE